MRIFGLLVLVLFIVPVYGKSGLPNVHVIATGGTIAGFGASSTKTSYKAGNVAVERLLGAVPELAAIANISSEQPFSIPSQDMTTEAWLQLSGCVNRALAVDSIDGIVITHGTDLIEETAFWLALTTISDKPIVLVGAMRPVSSLSADGPMNLFQAVVVAGDKAARKRGVMVAMNHKIYDAIDVMKLHTSDLEAIGAPNSSPIGIVRGDKVEFDREPNSKKLPYFNIEKPKEMPKVGILFGHADMNADLVDVFVENGYKGIVYAGVGNGNLHKSVVVPLANAVKKGVFVVRASRVYAGDVSRSGEIDDKLYGFICSGRLSPQKSRILLMLALDKDKNSDKIDELFMMF